MILLLHVRKRFEAAEAEYVSAKLDLRRKEEMKTQLTEHLLVIIQQVGMLIFEHERDDPSLRTSRGKPRNSRISWVNSTKHKRTIPFPVWVHDDRRRKGAQFGRNCQNQEK